MRHTYKFSLILLSTTMFLGCSEKSFTLQSYADDYFNNKPGQEEVKTIDTKTESKVVKTAEIHKEEVTSEVTLKHPASAKISKSANDTHPETINAAIKIGPGSDIAWSTTYKRDKGAEGKGALQKSLDEWFNEEWFPAFEGDVEQAKADKNATATFTLQHYVDKVGKYMDYKDAAKAGQPQEPAHYEKIKSMPVIGN